jgi:hypothetical protein
MSANLQPGSAAVHSGEPPEKLKKKGSFSNLVASLSKKKGSSSDLADADSAGNPPATK